jgi:4-hydroxyphenylpyruvate dioxygenase
VPHPSATPALRYEAHEGGCRRATEAKELSDMRLCLNQITVGRQPPADSARDLAAMRAGGWDAVELWLRHWDDYFAAHGTGAARRLLDDAGLTAAGACGQTGLFFSRGAEWQRYRDELARRLEQCQAFGAPNLVVTPGPGPVPEQPSMGELEHAAANLRAAGDLAAGHGVRLGLEFLKGARFVNNLPTAVTLAELANHPNVGVLVDTFHLYAGLSKVEDLELLARPSRAAGPGDRPALLSFVHLNDVPPAKPRELWTDPDRVLPGEGSLPLDAIFAAVRRTGYTGYVSLELFNEGFAARWAADPEAAARAAYQSAAQVLA